MNLEILLCLYFVSVIEVSGYWTRPSTSTDIIHHTNKDKKHDLVSRRHNHATKNKLHTDKNRNMERLITIDNLIPDKGIGKATKKMRTKLRTKNEFDLKNIAKTTLASGVLDPYSLRRQLQFIIDQTKTWMNATLEVIGKTAEFNDIVLIKMSSLSCKPKNKKYKEEDDYGRRKNIKYEENVAKKMIFIVHNLNPIGADNLGFLKKIEGFMTMLKFYVDELKRFDIFWIPVANPDGFSVELPYWHKNVSPQEGGGFGVNLDHNFDIAWKNSVENTESQFYQGPTPFSESETKAIRDIFFRYNHNMIAYLNIHASTYAPQIYKGDAILYPKGYSETTTNDDKYMDLRGEIDEALRNASLRLYSISVDTMFNWYGKVTGKSVDYASTIYGIPYALEICMQAYQDEEYAPKKEYPDIVLKEVWSRIFKVIFNNIEKSLHKGAYETI